MGKILVTGAGGFIGSHIVEKLIEQGAQVKAFVRYNSKNNWGWLEHSSIRNEIEVVTGDIRDYDSVLSAAKNCDEIYHLAALIGIPYSYVSPLAYIKTNIEGTYNVLQAAKENGCDNVIITSTSETYGTAQYVPIDEKHPMVGQSPYSASKISADQIAISYFRSFGLPVKIARPFNTFGPRQSARAIIPTIISQVLSGVRTIKLGNVHPTRDLTYVEDTAAGFIAIGKSKGLIGEITNIGMKEEHSVLQIVQYVSEMTGIEVSVDSDDLRIRPKESEVERLYCDNSKLRSSTDWLPQHSFKQGLQKTIDWMREHMHHFKPDIYNV